MKYGLSFDGDHWFFLTVPQLVTILGVPETEIQHLASLGGLVQVNGLTALLTQDIPQTQTVH